MTDEIRGLTVRQPWAYAIAQLGKDVENRPRTSRYRGLLAIHAGLLVGHRSEYADALHAIAENADVTTPAVDAGAHTRGAIVAVARLVNACSASLHAGWHDRPQCSCGPWAEPAQHHLVLADVRRLPWPVRCKGALGLWRLPARAEWQVRDQVEGS